MKELRVHKKIAAVCPIDGIRYNGPGNVEIDFRPEATQAEQDAALALVATLDTEVPLRVKRAQFKQAVLNSGQLAAVKAQYANLSDDAKLYWDDAEWIEEDSVLITELKALLGLTDQQVANFLKNAADL